MPWKSGTIMDSRLEFVRLAEQGGVSIAELCQRSVTPKTPGSGKVDICQKTETPLAAFQPPAGNNRQR
jgi:hypothetical protein